MCSDDVPYFPWSEEHWFLVGQFVVLGEGFFHHVVYPDFGVCGLEMFLHDVGDDVCIWLSHHTGGFTLGQIEGSPGVVFSGDIDLTCAV